MDKINKIVIMILCLASIMAISSTVMAEEYDYNYDTTGAEIAFLGLAGALCIIPIVIFVLWIILAIWVYKDAKKRDSSGALWLLIVLITGIIGLIIWLVVRPPIGGDKKEPNRRCPNCGRAIPEDAKTCPYCSKKFE